MRKLKSGIGTPRPQVSSGLAYRGACCRLYRVRSPRLCERCADPRSRARPSWGAVRSPRRNAAHSSPDFRTKRVTGARSTQSCSNGCSNVRSTTRRQCSHAGGRPCARVIRKRQRTHPHHAAIFRTCSTAVGGSFPSSSTAASRSGPRPNSAPCTCSGTSLVATIDSRLASTEPQCGPWPNCNPTTAQTIPGPSTFSHDDGANAASTKLACTPSNSSTTASCRWVRSIDSRRASSGIQQTNSNEASMQTIACQKHAAAEPSKNWAGP